MSQQCKLMMQMPPRQDSLDVKSEMSRQDVATQKASRYVMR